MEWPQYNNAVPGRLRHAPVTRPAQACGRLIPCHTLTAETAMPRMPTSGRALGPLPLAILFMTLLVPLPGCANHARVVSLAGVGTDITPPPRVELCGTLSLPSHWPDGTPVNGLSDLVWERDAGLLYMVSDRGWLHRARPRFEDGQLVGLAPIDSHRLRDGDGIPLEDSAADAESLSLLHGTNGKLGDSEFWVSFERDHRLQRFDRNGRPLAAPIRPAQAADAAPNKGMEAMTELPKHGLILGLESSPPGAAPGATRLFTLDGKQWRYPLAAPTGSALTEFTADGNDLVALERAFAPPAPLVISLRRVRLGEPPELDVGTLASFSSADGWWLDNMEGLTRLDDGRLLLLSDDNASPLQRSLLVCLRPR